VKGLAADLLKVLEDPKVRENIEVYTLEQYHELARRGAIPEKTELLEGLVFHIMPKSALHTNIIRFVIKLMGKLLPEGYVLSQEAALTIRSINAEPEPDIMVCRGNEADFWESNPQTAELVVEIAVTSVNLDRYKAKLYAMAGVKEYWLLHVDERRLEILTEPRDGAYQKSASFTENVQSAILPEIRFALAEILPPLKK
jgi:Uma2 family endonuclease